MITDSTRNLFQFIDFMHSNIENFNQHIQVILDWKEARWQKRQCGQHYTEKLRMREIQKVVNEKWDIISEQIIEPIKSKTIELSICDLDTPQSIYTNCSSDIVMLLENFEEEDIIEIQKAKKQYIDFRNDINHSIISLSKLIMVFRYFDDIMKHVARVFYEDGDRPIPKIKEIPYAEIRQCPESFHLTVTLDEVEEFYNKLIIKNLEVIHEDTDFDYFTYAIAGGDILIEKLPYKPIRLKGTIENMHDELLCFLKKHKVISKKRKTIPQKYKDLAEKLFLNEKGNPLKLFNPK